MIEEKKKLNKEKKQNKRYSEHSLHYSQIKKKEECETDTLKQQNLFDKDQVLKDLFNDIKMKEEER